MGIPDHLTCLLRNLYAGKKATVKTGHGATDWFQIGKGVPQGCMLSPCLFNWYAEYIMRNTGREEAQAGIKIARRNINNLRYAHDTTLMSESEEELKSLLMKAKECRGPAREIPHMTRSFGEAWWARRVRLQGFPLGFPEHLSPKTKVCLPYCAVLSTLLPLKGTNLGLQLTVSYI